MTQQNRPLVPPHIEKLKPYKAGKAIEALRRERSIEGEILKLASNENPLGPSPEALKAATEALQEAHLYPEVHAPTLTQKLAEQLHVSPDQIVLGNGSDELMELLVRTFGLPGDHGVISAHSFAAYRINLQSTGMAITTVAMRSPLTHNLDAIYDNTQHHTRFVLIGNPNNPTGTYNNRVEMVAFLEKLARRPVPPIVAIDEAYFEYADAQDFPDSLTLHDLYPNLVTFRTFSKAYGLAGFRIGYMVLNQKMASYIKRLRKPFSVNRIAQAAALAALDDQAHLSRTIAVNRVERLRVTSALVNRDLIVYPSQTNFILVKFPVSGEVIYDRLLDCGIITRPVTAYGLDNCLRISLGTPSQNDQLLLALSKILPDYEM